MHELQLVGVHEDGDYLVLATPDGQEEYWLTIDERLRSAIRFQDAHPRDLRVHHDPAGPVEVQAMIRAGATAQEAAQRAGWTVEKVRRYEGPILAEREHIAQIATGARLRPRGIASGAPILRDRVERRLAAQGVQMEGIFWDSRRDEEGQWTVELHWDFNERQHMASWHFMKSSMALRALDAAARALSEDETDEALNLVPGARRDEPTATPQPSSQAPAVHDPDSDLVSSMREHTRVRTRRRGPRRVGSALPTTPSRSQDEASQASPPLEPSVGLDADTDSAPEVTPNPAAVPSSLQDSSSRGPADASAVPESVLMDEPHLPLGHTEPTEAPEPTEAGEPETSEPVEVGDVEQSQAAEVADAQGAESTDARDADAEDSEAKETDAEEAVVSAAGKPRGVDADLADSAPGSGGIPELLGDSEQPHRPAAQANDVPSVSAEAAMVDPYVSQEAQPAPAPVEAPQKPLVPTEPEQAPQAPTHEAPAKTTATPDAGTARPTPPAPRKPTQRSRRAKAPTTTPAPPTPIVVEDTGSHSKDAPAAPASQPRTAQAPSASPTPQAATAKGLVAADEPDASPASPSATENADEAGDRSAKPRAKRSRARRASVPAWDDIMFGAKPGEQ